MKTTAHEEVLYKEKITNQQVNRLESMGLLEEII